MPKRLKKVPDLEKLLLSAESFLLASYQLEPMFIRVSAPLIVLQAFAAEAYLKCIAITEGKTPLESHNLHELYWDLDAPARIQIMKNWDTLCAPKHIEMAEEIARMRLANPADEDLVAQPIDLDGALLVSARAFMSYRYLDEPATFCVPWLPGLVRSTFFKLNPAMKPKNHILNGLDSCQLIE